MGETHFKSTLVSTVGLRVGPSSRSIGEIESYIVEFTEPTLSSGPSNSLESYTVSGATTNSVYVFSPIASLSSGYTCGPAWCSTAGTVRVAWANNSASTNSGSTNRAQLLRISF